MSDPDIHMIFVMERARLEFRSINNADYLTEADKQQLKDAYVQNYVEPEARAMLKEKLAQRAAFNERAARRHERFHKRHRSQSSPQSSNPTKQ